MSIRIEVATNPQKLHELEQLCRVARQQGFPDDAYVTLGENRTISVRTNDESLAAPVAVAS